MTARAEPDARMQLNAQLVMSYVLFVAVAGLLIALFATPVFRVSRVEVTGATQARAEVEAAAGVVGGNIFTIKAATVQDAVWRVPNVLPCGVTLAFPNTVSVCVKMRTPVLGWSAGGHLDLVDKYGRIMSSAASTSLPTVRDTTHIPRVVGKSVNPWIVTSAIWVLRQMGRSVTGFSFGTKQAIVIHSSHGWSAILGLPKRSDVLAKRVAILQAVLKHGRRIGHPLIFADLRSENTIVRFEGVASPNGGVY